MKKIAKNISKKLGSQEAALTPGSFQEALDKHEKQLNIAREAGDRAREGDVNFNLGNAYKSHGDFRKAIECYEKSLTISRQAGNRGGEGDVYFNLGNAYESHGNFPKAIECYEKSLNIYRQAGNRCGEGNAYFNLGIEYNSHGDFPKAIECFEKSLDIYREAGNRGGEGDVYLNLGNAYKSHGDFPKAIECYEKSLNIYRQAGNRVGEGNVYYYLGNAYNSHGDFPKAIECYEKSVNLYRQAGDQAREEIASCRLEVAYISRRDFPKAMECYRETLNIAREAGSRSGVSWPLTLGDVSKAGEYREGHLKIVKEVGGPTEEAAEAGPYNIHESEDKSLALTGNIVESLVPPSCDPKETLHLDQTDLEQPTPETTAKDSNQVDVVKLLTNFTPAGTTESEDKSLALPCNVVESLVSPSCDPKEIVFKLKEKLHLDQADLEKPSAETTRMIRCLAATAKDSNRIDVVKHLREIMPAGTTGPLLPGKLDICDIPVENRTHLTIDMTVGGRWKAVADRLGLRGSEIQFLDERYPNPSEATLARLHGMNVDDLYDVLTECGLPVLADIL